jgi:hypothetical protein
MQVVTYLLHLFSEASITAGSPVTWIAAEYGGNTGIGTTTGQKPDKKLKKRIFLEFFVRLFFGCCPVKLVRSVQAIT